jgi:hypothetical protein
MFVVVMGLSFVIYKVFKQSQDIQAVVSSRIEKSFNEFLAQAPATMKVAEGSSPQGPVSYVENLKGAWRYQVDGGTLLAIAPVPTADGTPNGKPLPPELREEARKVLTEFVMGWARSHLKDTAKKDFVLMIQFADEAPTHP